MRFWLDGDNLFFLIYENLKKINSVDSVGSGIQNLELKKISEKISKKNREFYLQKTRWLGSGRQWLH